ncbi:hypothetical protein [Paraburkholderia sp. RL18-085-BIA-A]|uniref:hypothetical protein n=1 Tax=Paraburkholderia sp. RL18-085-BIA-A TaxID=3031633 RepID=UPI0038BBD088
MKERPILFSGPMVRALLDGSKTQTRRIVKPTGAHHIFQFRGTDDACGADEPTGEWAWGSSESVVSKHIRCPYGKPGDRLWVRETHAEVFEVDIPAGRPAGPIGTSGSPARPDWKSRYVYAADGPMPKAQWHHVGDSQPVRWTPSIHMPRAASRITLEVIGVRVERLQDCSDTDAEAEGINFLRHVPDADETLTPRELYMCLWDGLKPAAGATWADNPWVWVVEFKRA